MDRDATGAAAGLAVRYSWAVIVLHWLIAALLVFEVALGLRMGALKGLSQFAVFQLHKSVGITILLLMLARVVWRLTHRPPPVDAAGWERALAHLVHAAFYALLVLVPLSGWVIVSTSALAVPTLLFGVVPWPHLPLPAANAQTWHDAAEQVHRSLVVIGYGLVAMHVAGALKHHLVERSAILARMLPGTRPGSPVDPRLWAVGITGLGAAIFGLMWGPASPVSAPRIAQSGLPAELEELPEPAPAPSAEVAPQPAASSVAAEDVAVPQWTIQSGSSLQFATSWSGEAISGGFSRFTGEIAFSPDRLDQSRVVIMIDTASVLSGDEQRDDTLRSADWFATKAHGQAVFRATRFRKTGPDRYVADGSLRLKGVTAPLSLPFTLKIDGARAHMQGAVTIDRLAYRIGEGEFATTGEIPADVNVRIVLNAARR